MEGAVENSYSSDGRDGGEKVPLRCPPCSSLVREQIMVPHEFFIAAVPFRVVAFYDNRCSNKNPLKLPFPLRLGRVPDGGGDCKDKTHQESAYGSGEWPAPYLILSFSSKWLFSIGHHASILGWPFVYLVR